MRDGDTVIWKCQEPGWWTSRLGGIVQEEDGRWVFHANDPPGTTVGPFKTLREAMEAADSWKEDR